MTERQDIRRLQQGLRRVKGASGADGTDGVDGIDGAIGPTGSTGPAGADGADGSTGATGPAGVDGADGEGVALGGTANQALTKVDGTDFNTQWSTIDNTFVGSEPADNTILKDADIGGSVQAFSTNLGTYATNSLTAAELGELQNINSVTIANTQWVFLGAFDQGLASTDDPTFAEITATTGINLGGTAAANLLNDYEQDITWTPTYVPGSGDDFDSIVYQRFTFKATRVGNTCHCRLLMRTTSIDKGTATGTAIVNLEGLPFVSAAFDQSMPVAIGTAFAGNQCTNIKILANTAVAQLQRGFNNTSITVNDLGTGAASNFVGLNFSYQIA